MKCNHCNTEVADGTNFCPNCGYKIEIPQSLKCPQCNTEVSDGIKFCPNCGSPIGSPQPKKCSKCGTELEEGEKFCSNCGTPVGSVPESQIGNNSPSQGYNARRNFNNSNAINLVWDGERKKAFWNNPIALYVNNQKSAEFLPNDTFEKSFSYANSSFDFQIEYGKGPYNKTSVSLNLEPNHSYVCTFFMNALNTFGYELRDEQGALKKEDGNVSFLLLVLFILIPLAGFIFFFIKKEYQPLSAKVGLMMGFVNIGLIIIRLLLF